MLCKLTGMFKLSNVGLSVLTNTLTPTGGFRPKLGIPVFRRHPDVNILFHLSVNENKNKRPGLMTEF